MRFDQSPPVQFNPEKNLIKSKKKTIEKTKKENKNKQKKLCS